MWFSLLISLMRNAGFGILIAIIVLINEFIFVFIVYIGGCLGTFLLCRCHGVQLTACCPLHPYLDSERERGIDFLNSEKIAPPAIFHKFLQFFWDAPNPMPTMYLVTKPPPPVGRLKLMTTGHAYE